MSEDDVEKSIERKIYERVDRRRFRVKDEDLLETVEEVLDHLTMVSLYELVRRLRIKRVLGAISSGKEARIFPAITATGEYYALKVYLTFTREFKKSIWKYIIGDPRFEDERVTSTRRLMSLWCRKEYKNLSKMFEAGVSVPRPVAYKDNILVMSFIGEEGVPAPLLKEVGQELDDPKGFYEMVLHNMRLITCKARLVHGDLSEYNIMVWRGGPVVIDVSQAVHVSHPNALLFLSGDVKNVNRFFRDEVGIGVVDDSRLLGELSECIRTEERPS